MTKAEEWLYDNRLAIMYEVKKGRFKEVIEAAFNHEPVVVTTEVKPMTIVEAEHSAMKYLEFKKLTIETYKKPMTTNEAELSAIKFLKYARNLLKSL